MSRDVCWFVGVVSLALILAPSQAWAFCGFFASSAKADVYNDVTQVALMRHGTTTVLSMRNTYKGPVKDFAMVVPVPQVLKEEDVKTLNDDLFDRLDMLTAPRLVDYFEKDPCWYDGNRNGREMSGLRTITSSRSRTPARVKVEASFKVGEYDVEILSAKDSTKLESWLKANGYNIPKGASKALAPYIAQGMYFFVAKVDARKVKFDKSGEAMLSPLRFAYDSKDFTLPVRLGLLNSKGKQDLSVFLLSPDGRYEVSNYPNAFIPTNLVVKDEVRHNFSAFYDALLQRELDKEPGTVVTEYVWGSPHECDPCPPTGALSGGDIETLGRDVIRERSRRLQSLRWQVYGPKPRYVTMDALNELKPKLKTCYEDVDSEPLVQQGAVVLALRFGEEGRLRSKFIATEGFEGDAMESCVRRVLGRLDAISLENSVLTARLVFRLENPKAVGRQRWTLTRLRARYSPKSMKDDLRFVVTSAVGGGIGVPNGVTSYFTRFEPFFHRQSQISRFQGRYIILNFWEEELECKRPNRGDWSLVALEPGSEPVETWPEPKGSSGKKIKPRKLHKYIIAGPEELMSRGE